MTAGKALQDVVPFVDHWGQPVANRVSSMPKADEDHGRGDATALSACVADAAWQSSGELHEPLAAVCGRSGEEVDHPCLVFGDHGQRPDVSMAVVGADGSSTVADSHLSERQGGAASKS